MGEFFFSIFSDVDDDQPCCVSCVDVAEVQQIALKTLGGLLAEVDAASLILGRHCGIDVTDETGASVMTLTIAAEIKLHTQSRVTQLAQPVAAASGGCNGGV